MIVLGVLLLIVTLIVYDIFRRGMVGDSQKFGHFIFGYPLQTSHGNERVWKSMESHSRLFHPSPLFGPQEPSADFAGSASWQASRNRMLMAAEHQIKAKLLVFSKLL
jgi:hypothetical protein